VAFDTTIYRGGGNSEDEVNRVLNKLKKLGAEVTSLDVQSIYIKYGYKKEEINFLSFIIRRNKNE